MKIEFKDKSFLELFQTDDHNDLILVLCGKKSPKETTMSTVKLSPQQVSKIIDFLLDWERK